MSFLRLAVYAEEKTPSGWRTAHEWVYTNLLWHAMPRIYVDTLAPAAHTPLYSLLTGYYPEHLPPHLEPIPGTVKGLPDDVVEETVRAISVLYSPEVSWAMAESVLDYDWAGAVPKLLLLTYEGARHFDVYGVIPSADHHTDEALKTHVRTNPSTCHSVFGKTWIDQALPSIERRAGARLIFVLHRIFR